MKIVFIRPLTGVSRIIVPYATHTTTIMYRYIKWE